MRAKEAPQPVTAGDCRTRYAGMVHPSCSLLQLELFINSQAKIDTLLRVSVYEL